jgi:hypothetical protein
LEFGVKNYWSIVRFSDDKYANKKNWLIAAK